jgi:hypothetical protein
MSTGLLWHDNSGEPLPTRIRRAVTRYEELHGVRPTRCHVNPIHLDEGQMMIGIDLVEDGAIMPGYFWLEADET